MPLDVSKLQEAIAFCRSEAQKRDAFSDIEGALEVIGNMEGTTAALQKQIDALNAEIASLAEKASEGEEAAKTALDATNAECLKRIAAADAEIAVARKVGEDKFAAEKASAESDIAGLSSRRDELHAEAETLSATVDGLKSSVFALNEEIIGLDKKKSDIESAIDQIKSKL